MGSSRHQNDARDAKSSGEGSAGLALTLDTSGVVTIPSGPYAGDWTWERVGREGGLFTQGYIEALLRDLIARLQQDADGRLPSSYYPAFSDLAPETLARIVADCARWVQDHLLSGASVEYGRYFWVARQRGVMTCNLPDLSFPPLTPYLGDDDKVYLREAL